MDNHINIPQVSCPSLMIYKILQDGAVHLDKMKTPFP